MALLATLKSGAAYVPLDPQEPLARLDYMLRDSAPKAVLIHGPTRGVVEATAQQLRIIDLDAATPPWDQLGASDLRSVALRSDQVAYVIYTSGTTGNPKGVMNEHAGVANRVLWMLDEYRFGPNDVVLQKTPYTFDVSVWEFMCPLASAGRLVMASPSGHKDPTYLARILKDSRATVVHFVPSMLQVFFGHEDAAAIDVARVVCSGEALGRATVTRFHELLPQATLHNQYGPTETGEVTAWPCAEAPAVLIGRPIANTRAYVLDRALQPVPVEVTGELYISGVAVARGYLNQPQLTAERFLPNPFCTTAKTRMYKTGDLARWRADGTLECLGRSDFQVKIRGHRVELGEIEARLTTMPGVTEACVVVSSHEPGDARLVAYLVGDRAVKVESVRLSMSELLPEYMVPAAYVLLDSLPVTANGKLDRKALPAPDRTAYAARGYEAPRTEVERALCELWAELLRVEAVGRNDNFFELGGHSLLAITLIERMRRRGLHAEVRMLFVKPTVSDFAASIEHDGSTVAVPPNLITEGADHIASEMLTLVELDQAVLDQLVARAPGGARNIQDIYPLAPLQAGILFHHLLDGAADPYIVSCALSFEGRERLEAFLAALQLVIDRHDILRTAVFWEELKEPVQVVQRRAEFPVETIAIDRQLGPVLEQLSALYHPSRVRFDVSRAPLARGFASYDAVDDKWFLLIQIHHLMIDHTTLELVLEEVAALQRVQPAQLTKPVPFREFVARARLGVSNEEHESFFSDMLHDIHEPTTPLGLVDVHSDGGRVSELQTALPAPLAAAIRDLARRLGITPASVMHLAWALVLARFSAKRDVVFGTVMFGRMHGGREADQVLGMFINTLPVRVRLAEQGLESALRDMHLSLARLIRHEHAPLVLAQRCSGVPAGRPLFTALLNYRYSLPQVSSSNDAADESARGVAFLGVRDRTNYPLVLSVDDHGDGFTLMTQVNGDTAAADRVNRFMQTTLEGLVSVALDGAEASLGQVESMPAAEREQVLRVWNATRVEYAEREQSIHGLFEAQAQRTPDAIAVVYEAQSVSYEELNARANRLADYLRQQGVGPDVLVGVCLERGVELVVALLSVLKAGGAYVPLDPEYPSERLSYMLQDSGAALVLVHGSGGQAVAQTGSDVRVLDLEADKRLWAQARSSDGGAKDFRPEQLAYVLYTSGSTGRPKGAMNEHRGVVNRLLWMCKAYGMDRASVVLHKTPYTFDVSVWELLCPLLSSGRMVLARPQGHRDAGYLSGVIESGAVTMLHFVPSMLQAFLDHAGVARCRGLMRVVCSGEALRPSLAERFHRLMPWSSLHNLYGPTEAAVDVTAWDCVPGAETIPIGRPIANTRVYVLDAQQEPVPVGVRGELYIAGVQVGRGYLNLEEETAARFSIDRFEEGGARMYRTGDVARWRADGSVEYLGRNDFQVKVRGVRIELGEVESQLSQLQGVSEVVVVAREVEPGSGESLVAYYTSPSVEASELRQWASAKLPQSMVPSANVRLERLPLLPNGKLDRGSLPAPGQEAYVRRGYEAPQGELEETLAEIWSELLKAERVGRQDNFFELGGHSLSAVQLLSELKSRLDADVALRELFAHPTLAGFAAAMGASRVAGQRSTLVPLRAAGTAAPLFFIHPGQGIIGYARELVARLDPAVPAYTLEASGFVAGETPSDSIEEMAARYVQEICRVQSRGPHRIVGYCTGGVIAYAMAERLLALGQAAPFIGLIDTYAEVSQLQTPAELVTLIEREQGTGVDKTMVLLANIKALVPAEVHRRAGEVAQTGELSRMVQYLQACGFLPPSTQVELIHRVLSVIIGISTAAHRYHPKPLPVSATLFSAAERLIEDATLGRGAVLGDALRTVVIGGDHMSLMAAPHIDRLVTSLATELARFDRTVGRKVTVE
ncbi:MAG TPA: amino acid adenylation domain-containing protein [Polyangiales bacterium]|nr:amino acid adenylation domain-containing protein [Polyangiales bacterium]